MDLYDGIFKLKHGWGLSASIWFLKGVFKISKLKHSFELELHEHESEHTFSLGYASTDMYFRGGKRSPGQCLRYTNGMGMCKMVGGVI